MVQNMVNQLPRTTDGFDSIWVIVDRLTKVARFLPIHMDWPIQRLSDLYFQHIVPLHGVLHTVTSDRDPRFLSVVWRGMMASCGTTLSFNLEIHPQTDGQTERVN